VKLCRIHIKWGPSCPRRGCRPPAPWKALHTTPLVAGPTIYLRPTFPLAFGAPQGERRLDVLCALLQIVTTRWNWADGCYLIHRDACLLFEFRHQHRTSRYTASYCPCRVVVLILPASAQYNTTQYNTAPSSTPGRANTRKAKMGRLRWMCCQCGNAWMVVKDEENICSYDQCQHERCNGCTTVMMNVPKDPPGITPICGPAPDQIHLSCHHHPHHQHNDEEDVERPLIRPSVPPPSPACTDGVAEATISHRPCPTSGVHGDHDP
jgi:hypothetical protein